jgi:hypothetical protein
MIQTQLKTLIKFGAICAAALSLAGCKDKAPSAQDQFFDNVAALCGKSFAGKLVSTDAVDADFISAAMVMHVRDCSDREIRIPFHVDGNRSRTWIISRTDVGLRLKHDHRHEDGHEDAVTMYGGDTDSAGTALRQDFPVDQFSIDMFNREGLTVSVTNIWSVIVKPGQSYTYQLAREGRDFRVEFDLTQPVNTPPPAWGHDGH